jgi:hypothetical protein
VLVRDVEMRSEDSSLRVDEVSELEELKQKMTAGRRHVGAKSPQLSDPSKKPNGL